METLAWLQILLTFSTRAFDALVFVNPAQKFGGDAVDVATNPVHLVGSNLTVE